MPDHQWMIQAECIDADVELFFADGRNDQARRQTSQALAMCLKCHVRVECLNYYMTEIAPNDWDDIGGVWGGTTLATRRRLRNNGA